MKKEIGLLKEMDDIAREYNFKYSGVKDFVAKCPWDLIGSDDYIVSEKFATIFCDHINWKNLCIAQRLSENFIKKFKDKIPFNLLLGRQKLSESLLREIIPGKMIHMTEVCRTQNLSEDFIRDFKDYVDWAIICQRHKLTEDFIIEFKDLIYWGYISEFQKLSENFIRKYADKLDFYALIFNKEIVLSKEIINDYSHLFNPIIAILPNGDEYYMLYPCEYALNNTFYSYRLYKFKDTNRSTLFCVVEMSEDGKTLYLENLTGDH